jgi:hypothetical protein
LWEGALTTGEHRSQRHESIAVDARHREIMLIYSGSMVRSEPRVSYRIEVRVLGPAGERRFGAYTFDHTPWEQLERPQ